MKALIQRVSEAKVTADGKITGQIGSGLLILLGIKNEDMEKDAEKLANKIINLRVFPGDKGHFDKSITTMNEGADNIGVLVVSQFTLYGSCDKGRRPDFTEVAPPERAQELYEYFVYKMRETGVNTETGKFGAMMDVHLVNNGPVTFMLES
jgi:D-tyrosyl-tRNA(Tyr) deacylase